LELGGKVMSLIDYKEGLVIASKGYSFYGLLQALIRQADSRNLEKLEGAFPLYVKELRDRYNTPGGILPGDETPRRIVLTEITEDEELEDA
jgi:hypothetical protein